LKKTLSDRIYYLCSAKQAADYETTTQFLINHKKKTVSFGNNIGTALETESEYNLDIHKHTLTFSKEKYDDKKEATNKKLEIEFKEQFSVFMKRKQSYETNTLKAYAFLWGKCAKGMQSKIKSSEKFESEIKNNPIKLLEYIKKYTLNYHEHRYEMSIMLDALRSMILLKQKKGESLQDSTIQFNTSCWRTYYFIEIC
jgi:hypothetical protein